MATQLHKFTDMGVKALGDGRHSDGGGLYLYVKGNFRSWVVRYTLGGKRHELGIGGYPKISLSAARNMAADIRRVLERGGDPKAERDAQKKAVKDRTLRNAPDARSKRMLSNVVRRTFEAQKASLKGGGSAGRWMSPLNTHIIPKLGKRDVEGITPHDLADVLRPIWNSKSDVARKALQRIGKALSYARSEGLNVERDVVADARDILGKQVRVSKRIPSMNWRDVPGYYSSLGDGSVDWCLRLLILTGVRSKPARLAHVDQFVGNIWTVPAENMKGSAQQAQDEENDFVVPLSNEALGVIEAAKQNAVNGFLFTSSRGKPISDMAMSAKMRRDNLEARPHGFRASLRTWADEETRASYEAKETVLGHKVGGMVERAYARSDLIEQRSALLNRWAEMVTGEAVKVVDFPSALGGET